MTANNETHKDHIFKGIFFGLAAFFLFAVMNAAAKTMTDTHSIFELSFWRSLIALIPFAAYLVIKKRYNLLRVKQPYILTLRVLIGISGLVVIFGSYKYLPMADATLILMGSTIVTPILAFFVLREHMGIRRWAAVIFGLAGVSLVLQPSGEGQLLGIVLACIGAFTIACVQVLLRVMKEEDNFTITFYFLLGGVILTAPFMPFTAIGFSNWEDIGLITIVGLTGAVAQICLSYALTFAPASTISPFNFSGLLWATAFDIIIWSYVPGWPVFLGGAMILAAKLYILHRERVRNIKNDDPGNI